MNPSPSIQTYTEAFKFLLEFTDYEKVTSYKYDIATFNLARVEELMTAVGAPHRAFRSVHIAGTKGKGSTGVMAQSILTAAGFRTGLYTSPHLTRIEERMTIDGRLMPEAELIEIVNELADYTRRMRVEKPNESPTFFELVTAAAFRHFQRQSVEFAVVEVGMGGRLDATNIIVPEVAVITRVDFDHVERLGKTLAKIAWEKAGIIKEGVPVVCGPQEPEALGTITAVAKQRGAPLTVIGRDYTVENVETGIASAEPFTRFDLIRSERRYEQLSLGMLGEHQAQNAAAAVAAVEILAAGQGLDIGENAIREGLKTARLAARSEFFNGRPLILLDGAHNAISIRGLCRTLDRVFSGRRIIMILGFSSDKDVTAMLNDLLPRSEHVIFTRSTSPRAMKPEELYATGKALCGTETEVVAEAPQALARARELAGDDDLICIAGSFFLAGDLRPLLVAEK